MPTQIPVRAVRSTVPSAIDVLMLSLLAAAINAIIVLIILWAYSRIQAQTISELSVAGFGGLAGGAARPATDPG